MATPGTAAYAGLLRNIEDGLQRCDAVAARTRSHDQASSYSGSHAAATSSGEVDSDSDGAQEHGRDVQGASSPNLAGSTAETAAGDALAGPDIIMGNQVAAEEWDVAAWNPTIDAAPAVTVQTAQDSRRRQQERQNASAASAEPGAAKLVCFCKCLLSMHASWPT